MNTDIAERSLGETIFIGMNKKIRLGAASIWPLQAEHFKSGENAASAISLRIGAGIRSEMSMGAGRACSI